MENTVIGFIGGGNMASSLIGGLLADGFPREAIRVAEPDPQRRQALGDSFGIPVGDDNGAVVAASDVVVLAVKPQVLRTVCLSLADAMQARQPLVLSIAAGVRLGDIERWLGGNLAAVRTMPNTPALVGSGATALYANGRVDDRQRELAEGIMRAVGLALWLDDEAQMDAVTAVSGSGPAYFFLVIEVLEQAGADLGLPRETARLLALQTAFGSAKLALESRDDSATLRARVTSPGGTTERALGILEAGDLRGLFSRAVAGACNRAGELADLLGSDR
jgi:pyrroline-5-carboxylate reductase